MTGESLSDYSALASYLLHTAEGLSASAKELTAQNKGGLFYGDGNTDYYLLYEPSVDYLRSSEAMLDEGRAKRISEAGQQQGRQAVMFGAGKYIGQRELVDRGITFGQLPYEMYRAGWHYVRRLC